MLHSKLTTFITLILTVWCSPIEPVFYNRITPPEVYWIQPPFYYTPIFHYYPSYFRGWYTFPVHPDHRPHPHLTRDNQEDVQALERLTELKESTRIHPEKVILSSIGKSPNPIGFRDKSLLGFFDNLSLRLVSRMSILPNIRLTYKNITLTGLAIG